MTSTEGDTAEKTFQVSYVISTIIIYTVTSPFTVQSNVLMTTVLNQQQPLVTSHRTYCGDYSNYLISEAVSQLKMSIVLLLQYW